MTVHGAGLDVFEILVKQNYDKVFRSVYFYCKDKCIAEDAVQQAFVIAYKKIYQLNSKDKFASWVISIALNEAKRMLNSEDRKHVIPITDYHVNLRSFGEEDNIELKEDINNVLFQLNHKEKEILVLKYFADLTLKQIAELLGINPSNAKVRLHRAKEEFRKLMGTDINQNIGG